MVWPQITEPRCGCAGAARRYSRPWGRGMRDGADSLPPRGVQIGIIQLFATMASPWAVPYEKLVTSALGTRCLVVSSRCLVSLARPAPPPLPPCSGVSFLTAAAGRPHHGVPVFKTASHPCSPFRLDDLGWTPTGVSQTARWLLVPLHSRSLPRGMLPLPTAPPSPAHLIQTKGSEAMR